MYNPTTCANESVFTTKQEGPEEIAIAPGVSGLVKNVKARQNWLDRARHHRLGRKPMILASHCRQMRSLLANKPDSPQKGVGAEPGNPLCAEKMGLTYKKTLRASEQDRAYIARAAAVAAAVFR